MLIKYTPEDGEAREWKFKPGRVLSAEAELIEDVTGLTYSEFQDAFLRGSMKAIRAAWWILRKREEPKLRFADTDNVYAEQLSVGFDDGEVQDMRDWLARNPDGDRDRREAIQAVLDNHTDDALDEMVKDSAGSSESAGPKAGPAEPEPDSENQATPTE